MFIFPSLSFPRLPNVKLPLLYLGFARYSSSRLHSNISSKDAPQHPSIRSLLAQYAGPLYTQDPVWSFSDLEDSPERQRSLRFHIEARGVDDFRFLRWRNALSANDFTSAVDHLSRGLQPTSSIFISRKATLRSRRTPFPGECHIDAAKTESTTLNASIRQETPAWIFEWLISNKISKPSQIPQALDILRRYSLQDSGLMLAEIVLFCILAQFYPPLPRLLAALRSHEGVNYRIFGVVMRALASGIHSGALPYRMGAAARPRAHVWDAFSENERRSSLDSHNIQPSISAAEAASTELYYTELALYDAHHEIELILETMLSRSSSASPGIESKAMHLDNATFYNLLHSKPSLSPSIIRLLVRVAAPGVIATRNASLWSTDHAAVDEPISHLSRAGLSTPVYPANADEAISARPRFRHSVADQEGKNAALDRHEFDHNNHNNNDIKLMGPLSKVPDGARSLTSMSFSAGAIGTFRSLAVARQQRPLRRALDAYEKLAHGGRWVGGPRISMYRAVEDPSFVLRLQLAYLRSFAKDRRAHDKRHFPRHITTYFRRLMKQLEARSDAEAISAAAQSTLSPSARPPSVSKSISGTDARIPTVSTPTPAPNASSTSRPSASDAWNVFLTVMARQNGFPARQLLLLLRMLLHLSSPARSAKMELQTTSLTAVIYGLLRRGEKEAAYEVWLKFVSPRLNSDSTRMELRKPKVNSSRSAVARGVDNSVEVEAIREVDKVDWVALTAGGLVLSENGRLVEAFRLLEDAVRTRYSDQGNPRAVLAQLMRHYSREMRGRRGFDVDVGSRKPQQEFDIRSLLQTHSNAHQVTSFISSFMRKLVHQRRPDVVYALWDAVVNENPLFGLDLKPSSFLLNTIIITASAFSGPDSVANLRQHMAWGPVRSTSSSQSSAGSHVEHIQSLLQDSAQSARRDVGFWWGDRPAWQVARGIFREVVLGNWPELKNVPPPAQLSTDPFSGGISAVRPLWNFSLSKSQSPPKYTRRCKEAKGSRPGLLSVSPDILPEAAGSRFSSPSHSFDALVDHPITIGKFPSVVPDQRSFDAYIRLLCAHGLESEIPETLSWMRELGIIPSQKSLRLALIRLESVGSGSPFDDAVLTLFSPSDEQSDGGASMPRNRDEEEKNRLNRWSERSIETNALARGNSPHAKLRRWILGWVGPAYFPREGALMMERKLWDLRLARISAASAGSAEAVAPFARGHRRPKDPYSIVREHINHVIQRRIARTFKDKHRRYIKVKGVDGGWKWCKPDLRKRTVGARWQAKDRANVRDMLVRGQGELAGEKIETTTRNGDVRTKEVKVRWDTW